MPPIGRRAERPGCDGRAARLLRGPAAAFTAVACIGCGGSPDVVGVSREGVDDGVRVGEGFASERQLCKAGHYVGWFVGTYNTWSGAQDIEGSIEVTLVESLNREFYGVRGGRVEGHSNMLSPFTGNIRGSTDCAAGGFDGWLAGEFYVEFLGSAQSFPFEGPVAGNYDPEQRGFFGTWSVQETASGSGAYGGQGEWNTMWVGP